MRRPLAGLLLTLVAGWLLAGLSATAASADVAASGDSVDSMKIGYTVTPDGVLHVREEIVYRFDEFAGRGDATGNAWEATLNNVSVEVTVPQDVQKAACFAGRPGATTSCRSANVADGKGVFGEGALPAGSELTVVAGIKAGAVTDDTPIVVNPPSWMERNDVTFPMLGGAGLVTLGAPVAGVALARRTTRDDRFAGLPPGSL